MRQNIITHWSVAFGLALAACSEAAGPGAALPASNPQGSAGNANAGADTSGVGSAGLAGSGVAGASGGSAGVANAGGGGGGGTPAAAGSGGAGGGPSVIDPGTEGDGDFYAAAPYEYGPDSEKKPGVPEGTLSEFEWNDSKTFPGTQRKVYVYVPAQYDPAKKTAVMIYQDGSEGWAYLNGDYRPRVVMDNLTAQKQIPVAVSIFIDHSQQRSYEYDSATGLYGQFVFEEILPEVESRYKLNLTHDPEGRAVIGESSGGIAAFSMAWWWPDQYRRVLSNSGSFVNIGDRGGDTYKDMVLASDRKPLRISLQDGSNDLNHGPRMNWSEENKALAAALKTKGYHYRFMYGEDAHGGMHGAVDFPDALRWLWRGYPIE